MKKKQLGILSIVPVALLIFGAFGLRAARQQAEVAGGETIAAFLARALDEPSKITSDHVATVIGAAAHIEGADRARQQSAARLFGAFAQGCLALGVLGFATLWAAHAAGKGGG